MMRPMPEVIQQAWGDAVTREFTAWIEGIVSEQTVSRGEWGQVDTRFNHVDRRLDQVEIRLEKVEGRLDQVEIRLAGVETRLTVLDQRLSETQAELRDMRRELNDRIDRLQLQMVAQTRWMVGSVALFGTIFAILMAIGQLTR